VNRELEVPWVVLEVGEEAPEVSGTNQDGNLVELTYERPTVVYFYPEDDTPGCTTEAEQFERESEAYEDAGVEVYGVSRDSVESHREISDKLELSFDLLADPDGTTGQCFDVPLAGDRYKRMTYVVVDEKIRTVHEDVNPDEHARDLLMELLEEGVVSLE